MSRAGDELNLTNRLVANAISDVVQLAKYIKAPIALRYDTSGLKTSSLSLPVQNEFFSHSVI